MLHLNENTVKSEIHVFTEETLEMCKEVQLVYKSQPNSKYNVIELPDSVDNTASGYHSKCYRNYIAVSTKAKQSESVKKGSEFPQIS